MAETRRIFAAPEAFARGELLIEGERLRHVRSVLRLRPGDELAVTDGRGAEYRVRLSVVGGRAARAAVLERAEPPRESRLRTVLVQAISRAERYSLLLEKAVELGVTEIVPALTRRTSGDGGGRAGAARARRWMRVMEAAVAQSGRTRLPLLRPPRPWEEILAGPPGAELRVLLWERAQAGLREVLDSRAAPEGGVLVAVGPEGGWTDDEAREAREAGFALAGLGPRILRTETAGIAALAVLQHRWGDLG